MNNPSKMMRPPEAAHYLGLSESSLAKWRCSGTGPAYMKVGERVVAYDQSELDSWLRSRSRRSTSEYAQ